MNKATIYPDLVGLCEHLAWRYGKSEPRNYLTPEALWRLEREDAEAKAAARATSESDNQ